MWVSGKVFDKTWDKVTAKKWYAQKLGKKPHKEIETKFVYHHSNYCALCATGAAFLVYLCSVIQMQCIMQHNA